MAAQLTTEQLSEIAAHPGEAVPLQDDNGAIVCYMVTSTALANLQELRALIQEGDESPDVPAEEAHARIMKMAIEADQRHA